MRAQSIDYVTRALFQVLPQHLLGFIQESLRAQGVETSWKRALLTYGESGKSPFGRTIEITDPSLQLKLLAFDVNGRHIVPTSPEVVAQAHVVRRIRNRFAHPSGLIGGAEAHSVLTEVRTLFELLEIDAAVAELDELLADLNRLRAEDTGLPGAEPETASESVDHGPPDGGSVDAAPSEGVSDPAVTEDPLEETVPEPGAVPEADGEDAPAPDAEDVADVPVDQRSEITSALEAISVEVVAAPEELLSSAAFTHPRLALTLRISGATQDIPTLRVSAGMFDDARRLTVEHDRVITLVPGEPFDLPLDLSYDRRALMDIDQVVSATLRVVLSASGERTSIVPDGFTCEVYGPRNWRLTDGDRDQSLLGFVQPQQPVLAEILREAGAILLERTGEPGLDAYQQDVARTDAIVDAILRAVHARHITYANPPASWAGVTQRIRSAEEVLTERLGTCLDTSMLVASLLEQAGIDAHLWLLRGHIFVGYWRSSAHDEARRAALPPALYSGEIDSGRVRLIETTVLTHPEYPGAHALHDAAHRRSGGQGAERVKQVLDVAEARRAGVYPLPVRTSGGDGEEASVVEYVARERDLAKLVRDNLPTTVRTVRRDTDVPARIDAWKRELLDLSLHNRLINLTPRAAYELAVPVKVLGAFEDLLHAGVRFSLAPDGGLAEIQNKRGVAYGAELDPPQLAEQLVDGHRFVVGIAEEDYTRALQKLAGTARTVIEETGSNNLYLTLGALHWESDGRSLVSPLVLVPVTLTARARGARYELALDETGSSTPNHSLLQRLLHDLELRIPGLEDPETDDAGIDLDKAFQAVRDALSDHGLPFHVDTGVRLGLFNFGGFRLWKDLDEDWRSVVANPLVRHLVETPTGTFEDLAGPPAERDLDELVARLPTTADASQAQVIAEAVAGRTLVVEGPPGTGKSQTITNLIVQAMVEGKRVLFVAEKQAALEVVSRRLEAVGVSDLVLNLHDVSLKPTAVKAKLRSALDLEAAADEEGLEADSRALEARRREIVRYRDALHTKGTANMSAYTAHTRDLAQDEAVVPLDVPVDVAGRITPDQVRTISAGLVDVVTAVGAVDARPDHPWRVLGGPVPDGSETVVADAVTGLRDAVGALPAWLRPTITGLADVDRVDAVARLLASGDVPWDLVDLVRDPRWPGAAGSAAAAVDALRALPKPVLEHYRSQVLAGPLDQVRHDLTEARGAMLGRKARMRRALAPLARWEIPGRPVADEYVEHVVNELLTLRDRCVDAARAIGSVPGLPQIASHDLLDPGAQGFVRRRIGELDAVRRARLAVPDATATELARIPGEHRAGVGAVIARVADAWRRTDAALGRPWRRGERAPLDELLATLDAARPGELTPRGLGLWNVLERAMDPLREIGLDGTVEQVLDGVVAPVDLPTAFEKGLARATFEERVRSGNLRSFDGASHDVLIDGFDALSRRVRDGARAAIRSRILRHRDARATRESRARTMELRRKVSGRERATRIRPLMADYGDVISRAMPCVLVSPESAARFIPLGEPMFDIVVFDEASQITVADAVGAMGRGRSVVVVGDSKQMPPTRFAELTSAQTGEAEEVDVLPDEESILGECVSAGVERFWLSHHYRSRSEDLIAFSNERYYEGRLATFPGPTGMPSGSLVDEPGVARPGVHMRRVEGTFLRSGVPRKELRTNPVEADAIVQEVLARFAAVDDEPSIGIVTFNMPQRDLIETRLREVGNDAVLESLDDPEGLFVKNLENVQGDERDTIFFSIGFSADAKGEVPLNFGPLNREGGERRLNVAVTRARAEVVVFCSFDPGQLHAERSVSIGLQDLRAYLDLAARGADALGRRAGNVDVVDRHRDDIAAALRARGLGVRTAIGLSSFRVDLGVGPVEGEPVLAVMLDGAGWASRGTAVDRELLPRTVLTGVAGWPAVERVWLLDWIERREEVVDRLVRRVESTVADLEADEAVDEAVDDFVDAVPEPVGDEADAWSGFGTDAENAGRSRAVPETTDDEELDDEELDEEDQPFPTTDEDLDPETEQWMWDQLEIRNDDAMARLAEDAPTAYRTAPRAETRADTSTAGAVRTDVRDPGSTGVHPAWTAPFGMTREELDRAASDPRAAHRLTALVNSFVASQYPAHRSEVAREVLGSMGLRRVRSTRADELWQVVDVSALRIDDDGFVWPASVAADEFTGYRRWILRRLAITDLHPREVRNVLDAVDRDDPDLRGEARMRAAMTILGVGRLTENVRSALLQAGGAGSPDRRDDDGASIAPAGSAPESVVRGRRRAPHGIEEELAAILRDAETAMAAQRDGRLAEAITDLTDVGERLTTRMRRLRKQGREGDASAEEPAESTRRLRGEVYHALAQMHQAAGDGLEATGFYGRAANDDHVPSMEVLATGLEEQGNHKGSLFWATRAAMRTEEDRKGS